uniref:AIG1 family protein n=1 Tax=Trepomonas sp. PC1 TaxID=1076344 RepID=A0A146KGW5_9EUKA|eukprot:JAP94696.1 AIG1 family protein [Trepomonas sp. PC1]
MQEVALIGSTGNGKSSFGNRLLGQYAFGVSDNPNSETTETIGMQGYVDQAPIFVIDTPGINDSNGMTAEHLIQMVEYIKGRQNLKAIAIVINYHNPRFDEVTKKMFRLFWNMLPNDQFWKHVTLVFTKCFKGIVTQQMKDKTRLNFQNAVAKLLKEEFQAKDVGLVNCVFVDSEDYSDVNTQQEIAWFVGWMAALNPMQTELIEQPNAEFLKVEVISREEIIKTETKPVYETQQVPNIVDVQVPNLVPTEVPNMIEQITLRKSFGFAIGPIKLNFGGGEKTKMVQKGMKTEIIEKGTKKALEQQGTKPEEVEIGKITTTFYAVQECEKRTHLDGYTVSYTDWKTIREYQVVGSPEPSK